MVASPRLANSLTARKINSFTRRSFLPTAQDFLWKIETGVVRTLTLLEDGTSVALGLWGADDIVGRVLSKANPYQIECLTPVQATIVPKQDWYEVTEAMISHIQQSGELMEILHCRQAEASLLRLFAWLAQRFGQQTKQGKRIDLRLTHQDIAELTGLTRVTVTRILKNLENQGLIQRQDRSFIVLQDQSPFWHYEI